MYAWVAGQRFQRLIAGNAKEYGIAALINCFLGGAQGLGALAGAIAEAVKNPFALDAAAGIQVIEVNFGASRKIAREISTGAAEITNMSDLDAFLITGGRRGRERQQGKQRQAHGNEGMIHYFFL